MRRFLLPFIAIPPLAVVLAAFAAQELANPAGILVLDNCDDQYTGKKEFKDILTLVDATGRQMFRLSGFNNSESIGSSRLIVADPGRKCIWVSECSARRIRRFDLSGKQTLIIPEVRTSAIAVDLETGNVWALAGIGRIGAGRTVVYDEKGREVGSYDIPGFDIVYHRKAKALWVAGSRLTKITAEKVEVVSSVEISIWCASSVDVDPSSGAAWVAVRRHSNVPGSRYRLLKFGPDGKQLVAIDLGEKTPFRVSVDPKYGSVWVAHFKKSIERFSSDGKSEAEYPVEALAVQTDPTGGNVWVVTPTELQYITSKGEVTKRVSHAGITSQAWIAALE